MGDEAKQRSWFRVGDVDMLATGRVTTVQAGHYAVCLTRTEKDYGAISNRCAHQGGPLGDGFLQDGCVVCPWHGYRFDVLSGECTQGGQCRFGRRPVLDILGGQITFLWTAEAQVRGL